MAFEPGVTPPASDGRLYLLAGQALCVAADGALPIGEAGPDAVYLGLHDGVPCFAREVEAAPEGTSAVPLRKLFGAVSDETFAIAGRALGLTAWDRDHRFCGRCGAPTGRSAVERLRTCTACGHGAYPRLSPAVIVLVERDGHALLARNPRFPVPFFSTLAGFVEVGETLEHAVSREIREEAGIEIADIRYFGSQPWPFSGSLMIGFTARHHAGDLVPDPTELAEAGWYPPHALPPVPPKLSIARALIDDFVHRHAGGAG
ncbi:MAG: NAD(+) diphosphatase [Myxococcota bacterium]